MKKCLLMCIMSFLLVLGLSATASADWVYDEGGCDDAYEPEVADKNILKALVEVFPDPNFPREDPWMTLCMKMCPGSGLPGVIIWEFDADNDPDTGGTIGMMGWNVGKKMMGGDITIMKALREQGKYSAMADCGYCWGLGGKQCAYRGDPCTGDCSDCFELGAPCYSSADPNCHLINSDPPHLCGEPPAPACPEGEHTCYLLDEPCPSVDCSEEAHPGKWEASSLVGGAGGVFITHGRTMPMPPEPCNPEEPAYCEKIPWGWILEEAHAKLVEIGWDPDEIFNLATALVTAPNWQVSTYFDPTFADEDDYVTLISVDATDWMPETQWSTAPSQVTDGGLPHRYQTLFHYTFDMKANQRETDYHNVCKRSPCNDSEGECNTCGCYWRADKEACMLDICITENSGDGIVSAPDYGALKKEFLRTGCP